MNNLRAGGHFAGLLTKTLNNDVCKASVQLTFAKHICLKEQQLYTVIVIETRFLMSTFIK